MKESTPGHLGTQPRPELTQAEIKPEYDVVVVGFGPAGAVATCWLGQAGLRTLAVDKSTSIWQIPRAVAIDHEILRTLQNLEIAEAVLPFTAPFPASEHFGAQGQLIRRIDAVPPPFPLGYTPTMVFTQPAVEAVLRKHAASFPSVDVRLGLEIQGITQDHEYARVELIGLDGARSSVRARYVIGCDGASSTVRKLMGIQLQDLGFDEPWLVVDVKVNEASLSKLPITAAQYCNPARPTTYIVGPQNHRRWEIMLSPGEVPHEMETDENVWRLLAPWLLPADGALWRASSYRFHALVAKQWRKERVFLAGDAAHQQPPFIGQGMCQGIRDVTNLCWKLQMVLSGEADESLLDFYEVERSSHVHTLTSRIKAIGHYICERDPDAARRRDQELLNQGGGKALTVTRQEIIPPLKTGLLADGAQFPAGTMFPQPWVDSAHGEQRMDVLAGHGWRLVLDGRTTRLDEVALAHAGWPPIKCVVLGGEGLTERDGLVAAWFDRYRCLAALVRPDHYVYGIMRTLDEIPEMLTRLEASLRDGNRARHVADAACT